MNEEEIIDEFCNELAKWLNEFEDIQPWENDDISEEKWAEYKTAVKRLLQRVGDLNG